MAGDEIGDAMAWCTLNMALKHRADEVAYDAVQ